MATTVKQNGTKKQTTTSKAAVKKKLTEEAIGKTIFSKEPQTPKVISSEVNLDERIQKFEKLRGLATQRERLVQTLTEITKFNYNQDDSSSFYLRDSRGNEFKTTNNNLIKLVSNHLQGTLESRKKELETEILTFEL